MDTATRIWGFGVKHKWPTYTDRSHLLLRNKVKSLFSWRTLKIIEDSELADYHTARYFWIFFVVIIVIMCPDKRTLHVSLPCILRCMDRTNGTCAQRQSRLRAAVSQWWTWCMKQTQTVHIQYCSIKGAIFDFVVYSLAHPYIALVSRNISSLHSGQANKCPSHDFCGLCDKYCIFI